MAATLLDGLQAIRCWTEERDAGVRAVSVQLDGIAARLRDDCSPRTDRTALSEGDDQRRRTSQQDRDPFSAIKGRIGVLEKEIESVSQAAGPLVLANLLTASSKAAPLSRHDVSYILEHCIDGDTIVLRPGCYRQPLVLQRPHVTVLQIRSGDDGGTWDTEEVPVVIQSGGNHGDFSGPNVNVPCIAISSTWKNVELRGLAAEQLSAAPTAALHVDMCKKKPQSVRVDSHRGHPTTAAAATGAHCCSQLPRTLKFVDCRFQSRSGVAVMLVLPEDADTDIPSVVCFERCRFLPGRDSVAVRIRGHPGAAVKSSIQFRFNECEFDSRGESFVSVECCGVACPSVTLARCRFVCASKGTSPWCVVQVQNSKNSEVSPIPIDLDCVDVSEAHLTVSLVGVSSGVAGGGGGGRGPAARPAALAQQHVSVRVTSDTPATNNLETVQFLQ